MECKDCGAELYIMDRSSLMFENDDDPEARTRAYYIFSFGCRNPKCRQHEKKAVLHEKKVYID